MRRQLLFLLAACFVLACCTKEPDIKIIDFESSTLPSKVPFYGGTYNFKLSMADRTKSISMTPWQYRYSIGDEVFGPFEMTDFVDTLSITIPGNYTENQADIKVELSAVQGEAAEWVTVGTAVQIPALVECGGFYWAKGNLTVINPEDRGLEGEPYFDICHNTYETGAFFAHERAYAVPSANENYLGYAYTPSKQNIALSDIAGTEVADPCTKLSPKLRMPTYMELYYIYDLEDYSSQAQQGGVNGLRYKGSDLFMPYGGYCNILSGVISGHNTGAAYWGKGADSNSNGIVYCINEEYSLIDYDVVRENLAMVRCVKNIKEPSLVSYSPTGSPADNATYDITIKTDPGEFELYEIGFEASDGSYTQTDATDKKTEVVIHLPENDTKNERTWKIFVNRIYSGVEFVQPGMKNYAIYLSHSPKADQESGPFDLTVNCDSDMDSFDVEVKGSDGSSWSGKGGKDNLSVVIQIPENTSSVERTLSIFVNGKDSGKKIKQAAASKLFSLTWSTGYLTVKDGNYTFAGPEEKGMFFKSRSKYGVELSSAGAYQGYAYAPEKTEIAYKDIPKGDVDPCALVAPANTWRMPSAADVEELISHVGTGGSVKFCTDGEQNVYFAPSGTYYQSTGKVTMATAIIVWLSDPATKDGNYQYLMWLSSSTPKVSTGGTSIDNGAMVRCVKAK